MSEDKCDVCDGWGVVQRNVPYNHPEFGKSFPCPKCRTFQTQRMERIRHLSRLDHYQTQTFATFKQSFDFYTDHENDDLLNAYEQAYDFAEQSLGGSWLVLVGGTGMGKTHLAAAIGHRMVEIGRRTVFITVPDLLDDLRATFAPTSNITYSQEFDMLCSVEVLILDDLGVQSNSPWAQEKLYQLINHRYNRRLTTVITTNLSFSEMNERIASRLQDVNISNVLHLSLPDYRIRDRVVNTHVEDLSILNSHPDMTFQRLVIDLQGGDTLEKATFILKRMIDRRAGLVVIFGGIGSGKTHLAAATAHEWRERYSSTPIMVNTTALADYLKASFESNSRRSLDDRIRLITQSPLLVLDNYRITNKTSEWVLDKLAYLIDFRYNRNLPTIITLINEFATQLSELQPLTYSRLMDQNRVDWCGLATDDFRQVYSRRSMY